MSKRKISVEVYQCDNIGEDGERCTLEGERLAIKECVMCNKDLCSRHYQVLSVTKSGNTVLTYFFCSEHSEEFLETLVKTFGDTRPVAYAGMAK